MQPSSSWRKVFELLEEYGYVLGSLKKLHENFRIFYFCFEKYYDIF